MQHFLSTKPPADRTTDPQFLAKDDYVEVLTRPTTADVWCSCYVVKAEDKSTAATICWDQQFDPVFAQLNDPKYGAIYIDVFRKVYPTFFQLIDNAVAGRYGDGALAELVDPDDKNRKWFFAVVFNGVGTDAAVDDRMRKAIVRVLELGVQANREFQVPLSWKVKAKIGLRGGMVGAREGQAIADTWSERLDWLQPFFGD